MNKQIKAKPHSAHHGEYRGALLDEASFAVSTSSVASDLNLEALFGLISHWDRYPKTAPGQRLSRLKNIHIAVINKIKLDAEILHKLPDLKLILLTATGTDNVDIAACQKLGITVCNVTDYGTASVAQHVFALILALSTNLQAYAQETRSGAWSQSSHFSSLSYPITELAGKTLGIVGYGTLAKGVEKLARAFDMKIIIAQRPGTRSGAKAGQNNQATSGRLPLSELLAQVDVLSLHCPLVPETQHLINASALKLMKSSAILINTSRGAVVDNAALAAALSNGEIKAAGIDVLEQEPPPSDHPLLQQDIPNVILTPHIAWASIEARQRLLDKVAGNLAAWLKGKPLNVLS